MGRYLAGRLLSTLAALWTVATGTFLLMHAIPGDPFDSPTLPPAIRAALRHRYGLDLPLWRQYLLYWGGLLHGQLGTSLLRPGRTVEQIIAARLPVSAALGAEALLWSLTCGVALGLLGAQRPGGAWDWLVTLGTVLGLALPNFVVAVVLDEWLGVRARLLPVAGWGGIGASVLPALSLGVGALALAARLVRSEAGVVLGQPYVRLALAKGVGPAGLLWRHVLRNAALPLVTVLGPLVAAVVTGSLVIERIFAIPGLGSAFVRSVLDRDYPVILGLAVFYAAVLLVCNLGADLALLWLDPRLRLGRRQGL